MRLVHHIFALYIIVLSCMPCANTQSDCIDAKTSLHKTLEKHNHIDVCSPFCICMCCGNQITLGPQVMLSSREAVLLQTEKKATFYKNRLACNFERRIWQPPQLSELI